VLSVVGDQLARVALTILVFNRTHSALLAAVTFAVSVVPTFIGGLALSGLADRFPRRGLMITCDLARAGLVALMALPGVPLAVLVCLLFVVTMIGAPFGSARAALYPDILAGDRYVLGNAVSMTTLQFAQVAGFAVGGAVVDVLGAGPTLLADAATFVASALLVRIWVRARPVARQPIPGSRLADLRDGLRLVFADPALLWPMLLGWLAAFYNVPEAVAAPLVRSLHGGDAWVGLMLAAEALGACVGYIVFSRAVAPAARLRWMTPFAVAACGVLMLFGFRPVLPAALLIVLASGLFDCYQVAANAAFVTATPHGRRGQAFGIAQGGMTLGQGAAMIIAGAVAQRVSPALVIAGAGALGTLAALSLTAVRRGTAGTA
jgi:predicted MFS family arabinose efflux permease